MSTPRRLTAPVVGLCLALASFAAANLAHHDTAAASASTASASTASASTASAGAVPAWALPVSGTEIVNPGRGQYRWGGITSYGDDDGEYFPNSAGSLYPSSQAWPGGTVSYYRLNWRDVEPTEGAIDFDLIDGKIAAAAARGERFAFRIMVTDSCCTTPMPNGQPQNFPAWLTSRVNAWTYPGDTSTGDRPTVVPDWNDPDYLAAVSSLLKRLGQHYDGDDRIAFMDMFGYGNFGEWHIYPWEDDGPGPQGQVAITDANARKIVAANATAFPHTQLLSLTPQSAALQYALDTYPNIGLRVDCLGDASAGYAWPRMIDATGATDRWKHAPVVTEWCGSNYTTADQLSDPRYASMRADVGRDLYAVGRGQVTTWHVSLLSSGNFPAAFNGQKMTSQQFEDWSTANKLAGYRYGVAVSSAPGSVAPGSTATVSTTWTNAGSAPTYETWKPRIELRPSGSTHAAATVASSVDLRSVTPGSTAVSDRISVPAGTAAGTYDIVVVVANAPQRANPTASMPASFYRPIALAQTDRTSDGGYRIGTLTVT